MIKFLKLFVIISLLHSFSCKKEEKQKSLLSSDEKNTTTYYLIRHAEKDRSNPSNQNPHLTQEGHQRAEKWSALFQDISFDAVYTTNFHRTRETALPTANKNNIELTYYNPQTLDIKSFLNETKGQNILIVGHSDSTPFLVNSIINEKKYDAINDKNFANYYEIKIINSIITSELKRIP